MKTYIPVGFNRAEDSQAAYISNTSKTQAVFLTSTMTVVEVMRVCPEISEKIKRVILVYRK